MKIALVNIFKPKEGSGDGITEYTYQIYNRLKKKHKIDLIFGLEESKRVDILGRVYVETFFRLATRKLLAGNYDVIHITNSEIGYFAKALKKAGVKAKIVVSIHDFVRVVSHLQGGNEDKLQAMYDRVITGNTNDAIKYSDFIIFTSSRELEYGRKHYKLPPYSLVLQGSRDSFLNKPIQKRSDRKVKLFKIGYVGGLIKSRNILFMLKTAELLDNNYKFEIYGNGAERNELVRYKNNKNLQNVEFMGFADENKILKIYDDFDVFMCCSYVDAGSLPIEDAFARGLPVIVAKRNFYDEEIRRRAYQAKNPKHAAEIIRKLRQNGYPKGKQQAILKHAKTISWKWVTIRTEKVYYQVTGNQKR